MLQEKGYNNMLEGGILPDMGKSELSREDDIGPDFYRTGEVSSKTRLQSG